MTHTNDDEAMARLADAITPAQHPAGEAVPVAWGESYDGGAFFNTVSLTKTKHHTYPLYAHPPQPSVSVAEVEEAIHDADQTLMLLGDTSWRKRHRAAITSGRRGDKKSQT